MKATVVLCLILMMTPCPFGNGIPPSSQSLKAQAIAARDGDGWLKMADQAHFGLLKLRDDVSSRGDSNRRGHPDPKLISEVVGILGHVLRPPPEDDDDVQTSTLLTSNEWDYSMCTCTSTSIGHSSTRGDAVNRTIASMHSIMLDPCDDGGKRLLETMDLDVIRLLAPLTQCDRNRHIVIQLIRAAAGECRGAMSHMMLMAAAEENSGLKITGPETIEGLIPLLGECLLGWKSTSKKATDRSAVDAVRETLALSLRAIVSQWPALGLEDSHERQLGVLINLGRQSLEMIEGFAEGDKGKVRSMAQDAGIPSFMSKILARGIAINGPRNAARAQCIDLVRRSGVRITGEGEDALAVGAYLHVVLCGQEGAGGGTGLPIGGGIDLPDDRLEAFRYAAPYSEALMLSGSTDAAQKGVDIMAHLIGALPEGGLDSEGDADHMIPLIFALGAASHVTDGAEARNALRNTLASSIFALGERQRWSVAWRVSQAVGEEREKKGRGEGAEGGSRFGVSDIGQGGGGGMGDVADEIVRCLRKDVERERHTMGVDGGAGAGVMGGGTECVLACCCALAGGGKMRGIWDELLMTGVPNELIGALNTMRYLVSFEPPIMPLERAHAMSREIVDPMCERLKLRMDEVYGRFQELDAQGFHNLPEERRLQDPNMCKRVEEHARLRQCCASLQISIFVCDRITKLVKSMALGAPRGEPGGLGNAESPLFCRGGAGGGLGGVKSDQLKEYEGVHGAPCRSRDLTT